MTTCMRSFMRTIRLVVNQLIVPVLELPRESYLLFAAVLCKIMLWYYSWCKIHRDDTFVIYQFVCVTDPWAHMSFVHYIISLKLGVIGHQTLLLRASDALPSVRWPQWPSSSLFLPPFCKCANSKVSQTLVHVSQHFHKHFKGFLAYSLGPNAHARSQFT